MPINQSQLAEIQSLHPQFIERLLARGEEIAHRIEHLAPSAVPSSAIQEQREISDALERIRASTFGICEECQRVIPLLRLRIRPQARLCIACQSLGEQPRPLAALRRPRRALSRALQKIRA